MIMMYENCIHTLDQSRTCKCTCPVTCTIGRWFSHSSKYKVLICFICLISPCRVISKYMAHTYKILCEPKSALTIGILFVVHTLHFFSPFILLIYTLMHTHKGCFVKNRISHTLKLQTELCVFGRDECIHVLCKVVLVTLLFIMRYAGYIHRKTLPVLVHNGDILQLFYTYRHYPCMSMPVNQVTILTGKCRLHTWTVM